jgi:hypothetical protein
VRGRRRGRGVTSAPHGPAGVLSGAGMGAPPDTIPMAGGCGLRRYAAAAPGRGASTCFCVSRRRFVVRRVCARRSCRTLSWRAHLASDSPSPPVGGALSRAGLVSRWQLRAPPPPPPPPPRSPAPAARRRRRRFLCVCSIYLYLSPAKQAATRGGGYSAGLSQIFRRKFLTPRGDAS